MKKQKIGLANVAAVHPNGNATFTAGATIVLGDVLKFSGTSVIPTAAVTDAAIAVALDGAASGDIVPAAILGAFTGTVLVKAAGAIAKGAQIAATGVTTGGATDVIIGRALDAAAASGDLIEVAHQVGHVK